MVGSHCGFTAVCSQGRRDSRAEAAFAAPLGGLVVSPVNRCVQFHAIVPLRVYSVGFREGRKLELCINALLLNPQALRGLYHIINAS